MLSCYVMQFKFLKKKWITVFLFYKLSNVEVLKWVTYLNTLIFKNDYHIFIKSQSATLSVHVCVHACVHVCACVCARVCM